MSINPPRLPLDVTDQPTTSTMVALIYLLHTWSVPGGSHQQVDSCISSLVGICLWGNRNWLEAFLWKSAKLGYQAKRSTTFASFCNEANCKLFTRITGNTQHLLYPLFPLNASITTLNLLSKQSQLLNTDCTSAVKDKNITMKLLYSDSLHWQFYFTYSFPYCLCNRALFVILLKLKWNKMK